MNQVEMSKLITHWIYERVNGLSVKTDDETRVVAACFDMVLEHQQAVTILTDFKLYGSAFTLARSAFEAYVRGVWLRNCATDEQWKEYLNDNFRTSFGKLIDDIEKLDAYSTGTLLAAKNSCWDLLNSFTHTGLSQVYRRNTDEYIESNYSETDINKVVAFVNSISLLSGLEIVKMSEENLESVQLEFVQKMKDYANESSP